MQLDLMQWTPPDMDRGGATYSHEFDYERLNKQQRAVWEVMKDGQFRSLRQLSEMCGAPEASASARLRDFRKLGLKVDRQRLEGGLHLYR